MPFPNIGGARSTYVQENIILRILRGLQLVWVIIVLGINASNASSWHSLACSVPAKLGYGIAAAVITFLILVYLNLSTGKVRVTFLPWHQFIQLGLDVFLVILWIAAAAVAGLNCHDLCSSCSRNSDVYDDGCGFVLDYADLACNCYFSGDDTCTDDYYYASRHKRAILDAAKVFDKRYAAGARAYRGVTQGGKIGVNVIMLILLVIGIAATIFMLFQQRNRSPTTNVAPAAAPPTFANENKQTAGQAPQAYQQAPIHMQQQPQTVPAEAPVPEHPTGSSAYGNGQAADYYNQSGAPR